MDGLMLLNNSMVYFISKNPNKHSGNIRDVEVHLRLWQLLLVAVHVKRTLRWWNSPWSWVLAVRRHGPRSGLGGWHFVGVKTYDVLLKLSENMTTYKLIVKQWNLFSIIWSWFNVEELLRIFVLFSIFYHTNVMILRLCQRHFEWNAGVMCGVQVCVKTAQHYCFWHCIVWPLFLM